ncbi:MAG: NfeD family protein [Dysgonamonadaceae bacterium]|jgi:membrane-bound ClpP family serine protease|nr:NfeD family protein [Dysgonamonadaceae bacterium]
MDIFITTVLLILGIILILAEIFLLPGITIAIIGGALFVGGGLFYAYTHLGVEGGNIALVVSILIFLFTFFWLVKSKTINKIGLKTDIDSTVADEKLMLEIKEGDEGITVSRLNPIGKVKVNQMTVEAKTLGGFVDDNVEVVVLKVFPTQIVVKEKS